MTKHSVQDDGDLQKYYASIPNIVFELGLNPYELALYAHFKRAAGNERGGVCWKSRATIARESGMSSGMVTKARQALEAPRTELNGRPLIIVTEEPSKTGGKPTCRVTMTDIWAVNVLKFSMSPHDVEPLPTSPHDEQRHHATIATSPHDLKEEPIKNNQEEGNGRAAQARRVFGFWTEHLNHPKAILDGKRQRAIEGRLREGYTEEQLVLAVKGCKLTPYNMGDNKDHRVYDDIELICRDAAHVDRFVARVPARSSGKQASSLETVEQKAIRESCPRCFGTGTERTERGARACNHGLIQRGGPTVAGVQAAG